jgi:cell division protein FtsI (penicillin-binding protein 3)
MLIAAIFVFTVFAAQLLRVQALDAASVQAAAFDKRVVTEVQPALRGQILDRNGVVLASSVERKTIYADQKVIPTYSRRVDNTRTVVGVVGAAQALAPPLETTPEALVPQLMGNQYRIIAKDVTPLAWRAIAALGIPGIYSEPTTSRVYPAGMTAAPLVGFVQKDGTAGGGVEVLADSALKGTPGKVVYQRAQDGTAIPGTDEVDQSTVIGSDVRLTIDADLQWYAQNQIANMVAQSQAVSGYVVVQEVKTGKLRAVASYPTFDPTNYGKTTADGLANHAFQDVYEPGSTGKVMSVAAAIEQGLIQPTTQLIVPNRLPRGGTSFKDDVDHPTLNLTVAGALAMSSNIGTMLATEKLATQTVYDYFRKFGIGSKSGVGYPGESAGLLAKPEDWSGSQRYTLLFGQGYSLNAIQAAGVYQTDRQRRRPHSAQPRREHHRLLRQGHPGAAAAGCPGRLEGHRDQGQPDARGGRRAERHGEEGEDRRLPRRRQDRHGRPLRPVRRRLQRVHRLLHRVCAGGRPAVRRRSDAAAAGPGPLRRPARGPGVQGRHDVCVAEGADPADQLGRPGDPAQLGGRDLGPQRSSGPER